MRLDHDASGDPPRLSVVVTIYDMAREASRTLHSLSIGHQRGIDAADYEVVVVDNGSDPPFGEDRVRAFGENFRYRYVADASASPAPAMNLGAELATGDSLCLMIDGARIVTPGLLAAGLAALEEREAAAVETMAFHLGVGDGRGGAPEGFDRAAEDALLDAVGWPHEPYRLFDVSRLAGSSSHGWYGPINESNCLFVRRWLFDELGGFDERFDEPGGGFVNLDLYDRVVDRVDRRVRLVGEASFHQMHGGASTGLGPVRQRIVGRRWNRQYLRIRGRRFRSPPEKPLVLHGECGPEAQRWMERSGTLWSPS